MTVPFLEALAQRRKKERETEWWFGGEKAEGLFLTQFLALIEFSERIHTVFSKNFILVELLGPGPQKRAQSPPSLIVRAAASQRFI